jgi:flavin reductase (DIM6/NTAB) family NADH-FMN oxidoreductase RutF/DNA-binding GntR family transcriptional regulator
MGMPGRLPTAEGSSLPPATVDAGVYRQVIGAVTSGVMVLTARDNAGDHGMTISAVCSLSMEPPMLLVCLNTGSRTQRAVTDAGCFAVQVLDEKQAWIAERFARPAADDKFAGIAVRPGHLSAPILSDALAVIECEVTETVTGGTHRVFLARVVHAEARLGSPLAYFRGKFGRFELAEDAEVYVGLRAQMLDGTFAPDQTLDADQLARARGVGASAIHYALTRLVGEGLVVRTPDRGYVVTPIDAASSDEAHDARLVLDLGIADVWVGRLDPDQLGEFRALALATIPQVIDGQLQVDGFIKANVDFHAFLPAVTGNAALQEAYERLSIADLMLRAFTTETSVSPRVAQDHLDLVEAYEMADLARARAIIFDHHARAKRSMQAHFAARSSRITQHTEL